MKRLLPILIFCAYGAVNAMAPRLLMHSFRAPSGAASSASSFGIAKRWQHQSSEHSVHSAHDTQKCAKEFDDMRKELRKVNEKVGQLENDLNDARQQYKNIKDEQMKQSIICFILALGVGMNTISHMKHSHEDYE